MSEIIKEFKKGDLLYIDNDGKAQWGFPDGYPYKEDETIRSMVPEFIPSATSTTLGIVKQMPYLPNATGAAPTAEEFNALLKSLRDAGILATE